MIAFIDFEASSLSATGYPIEIAWILEDGTGEGRLIRPEPSWRDWCADAQAVHGITREMLIIPAHWAAKRLARYTKGHTLYSDAPVADERWLHQILATADLPPVEICDVHDVYEQALKPLADRMPSSVATSLTGSLLRQAEAEADVAVPVRHRAREDARRLWWTWRRLGGLVAEALDGWPG